MKKITLISAGLLSVALYSCNNTPDAHKAEASEEVSVENIENQGTSYNIDTVASKIEWLGAKPIGDSHTGTIALKNGIFYLTDDNQITSGEFVIDMNSIVNSDIEDVEKRGKLESHLKGEDFFDVAKYPEAKFVISGVKEASDADKLKFTEATHLISGNLTMKGNTKNVSLPAKVNVGNGVLEATSEVNIDRTQWHVNYNSDASIKDKFINKEINLKLHIRATK